MNLFINRIIFFTLFLTVFIITLYNSINILLNSTTKNNTTYIWGDSQTYYGINVYLLNKGKQKTLTAARPGSGGYDFLVFTEVIPEKALAIVGVSKLFFLRAKNRDRNDSGFSFRSLKIMNDNGYSNNELISIIKKNIIPKNNFSRYSKLFSTSDSLNLTSLNLSKFKDLFQINFEFVKSKEKIFIKGIENLVKKQCKIIFIEFPLEMSLHDLEKNSEYKEVYNNFKIKLLYQLNINEVDTINFDNSTRRMHDYTHLNELGAKIVTNYVINCNDIEEQAKFVVINNGFAK